MNLTLENKRSDHNNKNNKKTKKKERLASLLFYFIKNGSNCSANNLPNNISDSLS